MIITVHIQEMEVEITENTHDKEYNKQESFHIVEDRKLLPTKPNNNKTRDMLYTTSTQVATLLYTSTLEFFKCIKKGIKMKS